ncbi:helix-turn-helix transcriptional regulator [Arsenophonus nasoniae]|uniref:helix-turn-helix transcriptional regulator n=1 Tax=Arsenophonus nasoniae TaxID=638 RepID=UPI00387926DF
MNSEMIKFLLSSPVPCGFIDNKREVSANVKMKDLLYSLRLRTEMRHLLDGIHIQKSPFFIICDLSSDCHNTCKIWQFHFLPLFCHDNKYLGTLFFAHKFLFLSPLEYVDSVHPYSVNAEKPDKLFNDKEWKMVFFMMHRLNSKEIAKRLGISRSTVENKMHIIYRRADVHSACELRHFGKLKDFDRYIPADLIDKGCGFLKMGEGYEF